MSDQKKDEELDQVSGGMGDNPNPINPTRPVAPKPPSHPINPINPVSPIGGGKTNPGGE